MIEEKDNDFIHWLDRECNITYNEYKNMKKSERAKIENKYDIYLRFNHEDFFWSEDDDDYYRM